MRKRRHSRASPAPAPEPVPGKASILDRLFAPVDNAWLVFLRVAFGAVMTWEVQRYFSHDWIRTYFIRPQFHFGYLGLEWIKPWPGDGMYFHFAALGALAFFVMIGLFYRASALLFFLGFSYVFLLEEARYLNHFYLLALVSCLLVILPAHQAFSLDAWLRPKLRSRVAPAWTLWLMRFQVGLVYFFGGIAKLNGDWLRGVPLDAWLAKRSHFPVIGPFLDQHPVALLFSYGGLFLDLFIVPLLLWKRTRPFAFLGGAAFHLMNDWIFTIGVFPWFMLGATTVFFEPDWPRRVLAFLRGRTPKAQRATLKPGRVPRRAILAFLGAWAFVQVALPLRHWIYPGEVAWTEEGHRFSWRMKLRDKSGKAEFTLTDPRTGESETINPRRLMPRWQSSQVVTHPDMLLQFSHMLAERRESEGRPRPQVRVRALSSLNGRPPKDLVDPTVDLAAEQRTLGRSRWILPLGEALPPARSSADSSATPED